MRRLDRGQATLKGTGDESSQKIAQKIHELLEIGIGKLRATCSTIIAEKASQIEPLAYVIKNQALPTYSRKQVHFLVTTTRFCKEESQITGLKQGIYQDFISNRSLYMQKSLHTFVLASQRNLEIRNNNLYDRENNGIGHYTEALYRMAQSERQLCAAVFDEGDAEDVYNSTATPAFSDYTAAVKAIADHVASRLGTDCYLGFETLEHVIKLNSIVKDIETPEIARNLHAVMANLAGISASAFHELAEDIKRKAGSLLTVPIDGGVVEVTKELCARLRKFVDYPRVISDLISVLGDGGWRRPVSGPVKLNQADRGLAGNLIDIYCAEVVEALLQILEQKARTQHKRLNLVGIFLLNNATYIQTSINRSEMSKFMSGRPINRIDECNKKAFKVYRESWDMSARQLMDTTIMRPTDPKAARNSLSSKDREAVKERFKSFNTEFDESLRACKSFTVIDSDLRQSLTKEIRSIILPLYSRFYDKYINTDFAKNKEKYIKYSKESIEKAVWDSFS